MNSVYGHEMYMGKMDKGFIANNEDDCVLATCIQEKTASIIRAFILHLEAAHDSETLVTARRIM